MKKFKSKWFRVATEGMTTDGRKIERQWIQDMAATYNRETYGARIWMEHYRSALADGPFKAYGDVLAVKAEEVDMDGKKKLALFAQIEPTDDLVAMTTRDKQKIYTSIEVAEKFADSGKAYLMGLGVTDSPASLGTEVLSFSSKATVNPFSARKENPDNLIAEAVEVELEFEEVSEDTPPAGFKKLFSRVTDLLKTSKERAATDDAQFADIHAAVEALAGHGATQAEAFTALQAELTEATDQLKAYADLKTAFDALEGNFADLKEMLDKTPTKNHRQRPAATGGDGQVVTDC